MKMNESKDKAGMKFENVDIQDFLEENKASNVALRKIINKVAGDNPTVALGIESLMSERIILRSFERAFVTLISAKNDHTLQSVEAGFQTTINEVKSYHEQNSPYMTAKKTSLYLYSLQHLIMNLDGWKLPNHERNNFKPALKTKLQQARSKSKILGINDSMVRSECFSTDYQQPYDPVLRNFEFLDEVRLDNYLNNLRKYELTRNLSVLYDSKMFPTARATNQKTKAIETLIRHMEKKFKIKELNLEFYKKHFNVINQEIIKLVGADSLGTIHDVIDAITQYLEAKAQFQIQIDQNIGDKVI